MRAPISTGRPVGLPRAAHLHNDTMQHRLYLYNIDPQYTSRGI